MPVCSCGRCFCAAKDSRLRRWGVDTHSSQRRLNLRHRSSLQEHGLSVCCLETSWEPSVELWMCRSWQGKLWSCPLLPIHPDTLNLTKAVLSWHSKWDRRPRKCDNPLLDGLGAAVQPPPRLWLWGQVLCVLQGAELLASMASSGSHHPIK